MDEDEDSKCCRNLCKCCACLVCVLLLVTVGPLFFTFGRGTPYNHLNGGDLENGDLQNPLSNPAVGRIYVKRNVHTPSAPSDQHNHTPRTALIITNEIISDQFINTAQIFIERGDKVIIATEHSAVMRMEIMKTLWTNQPNADLMTLNTSDRHSVNDFITTLESNYSALNILIENAQSANTDKCELGGDRDERTPFYFAQRLLPLMGKAASQSNEICRIIYVASADSKVKCQHIYTSELNQRYANDKHRIYTLLLEYGNSNNMPCAAEDSVLESVPLMSDAKFIELTNSCQSRLIPNHGQYDINRTANISLRNV